MGEMNQFKCPNCGGALEFDSKSQKVKCPYCDAEFDIKVFDELNDMDKESTVSQEEPVWEVDAGQEWANGEESSMKVFTCKTCGGEIIADANAASMKCPYCDNPVVLSGNLSGTLKPDLIIPFKLDKKKAKDQLMKHLSDKALLPKVFKDQNHIDEIKGIYVPFWLFDGGANGEGTYKATKVRTWSDSDFEYTETSYFKVFRAGEMEFEKIPVDGSTVMPDDLMESIEPYDYKDAVEFKKAYLTGFLADKYDVTSEDSKERATKRIKNSVDKHLRNSVEGYDTVDKEDGKFQLKHSSAKYALLPVWILNTTWNGQKYTFAMNGQTGKFVGNLPIDQGLYWQHFGLATAISSVISFVIIYIISMFM